MAWWCIGSKAEAAGGVFQVHKDEPAPRVGRGCAGRCDRPDATSGTEQARSCQSKRALPYRNNGAQLDRPYRPTVTLWGIVDLRCNQLVFLPLTGRWLVGSSLRLTALRS